MAGVASGPRALDRALRSWMDAQGAALEMVHKADVPRTDVDVVEIERWVPRLSALALARDLRAPPRWCTSPGAGSNRALRRSHDPLRPSPPPHVG